MKFKKDFVDLCLQIAAKLAAVANLLADDGEEALTDEEGRVFAARALKAMTPAVIARALKIDEGDVRQALVELEAAAAAKLAEEQAAEPAAEKAEEKAAEPAPEPAKPAKGNKATKN